MALLTKTKVMKEYHTLPERSSGFYFYVMSTYLSEAYDLVDGDEIKGEVINVKELGEEFPDLRGKEITLILKTGIIYNRLFISKDDWKRLFREWGIVSPGYELELRLIDAIRRSTKERIKLYTERDVKWTFP